MSSAGPGKLRLSVASASKLDVPGPNRVSQVRRQATDLRGLGRSVVYRGRVRFPWPLLACGALAAACGGAPLPRSDSAESAPLEHQVTRLHRAADVPDDCALLPGKPPPKPLERKYTGVAAAARCQRQVYTIMDGVTHFLGVKCVYCHIKNDYPAPTRRKRIANWMARELIPRLRKQDGTKPWCNDCHVIHGKGTAKILGWPRNRRWAIEWMTTQLVADFQTAQGKALHCKSCHGANIGSPGFEPRVILTDHLPQQLHWPLHPVQGAQTQL